MTSLRCLSRLAGPIVAGLAILVSAAGASAAPVTRAQWNRSIEQVPTSGQGCYSASYPALAWHASPCAVAPAIPLAPSPVAVGDAPFGVSAVGNGNDDSAVVQGTIKHATGTFTNVSPGITEAGQYHGSGGQVANSYSLQMNSEYFSGSPACIGENCQAWEQFIYDSTDNFVYIQYWLIEYAHNCPRKYYSYGADCYTNSAAIPFGGSEVTPPELASTVLEATAKAGGEDELSMSEGGNAAEVVAPDSKLDLASFWNTTEWGVFGDGDAGQANFSANATLEPVTTILGTSTAPPSCVAEGFTGETNNLTLTGTPAFGKVKSPTMGVEQTNGSTSTATCATATKAAG